MSSFILRRCAVALFGALAASAGSVSLARDATPAPQLKVYHLGNSLTRNVPLERLQKLFAATGGKYDYGIQLGPGHRLEMHLSKSNGGKPGTGKYNTVEPYGEYDRAFKNFKFDAVVLQPFVMPLDAEERILDKAPWFTCGDLQAASAFIDYARGETKPGKGRWDRENPNTDNVSCERFFIYGTWPGAESVLAHKPQPTFAAYYAQPYKEGKVSCADFYAQLADRLNERHPDLPVPVRVIPAGEVLAALDEKIRAGQLPGIEAFYARNQAYFVKARRNNPKPSPFDPAAFDPAAGALNLYADNVHLNDQPHNGPESGAIGSYVAALTIYATLSGKSPVGLTAEPYEQFDSKSDAVLIEALQETVRDVVAGHRRTGVPKSIGETKP